MSKIVKSCSTISVAIVCLALIIFINVSSEILANKTSCPSGIQLLNSNLIPFAVTDYPHFYVGNLNGCTNPQIYCRRSNGGTFVLIGGMTIHGSEAELNIVTAGEILTKCTTGSGNNIEWKLETSCTGCTVYKSSFDIQ